MKSILFLINLCLLSGSGVLGECSEGCKEPLLLYDELKCRPIYDSPTDCCPASYDCSNIEQRAALKEEKCYLNGKAYNPGENVDNDEVYPNCRVGCTCEKRQAEMTFNCAILDCPEWLGFRARPGCYLRYEVDKCCSEGTVCPPFNVTCEVGGKTYHEGETFDAPHEKCTKCGCSEGFDGRYEPPFCSKQKCIEEVDNLQKIHKFCAPSYITLDDCCPWNWICPEDSDKIVENNQRSSDLQCKFGEKTLNIGDKFERTRGSKGKVSCECRIPPYLTCIQNYDYPSFAPDK